jgi:hypothetical protein
MEKKGFFVDGNGCDEAIAYEKEFVKGLRA